jgi:predicted Zn finger-like uncharacterized protein
MLTQCPHCLTLFRVGPEHLKAADGRVRCCRCHQVFNALQGLQDSVSSSTNPKPVSDEDEADTHLTDSDLDTPTEPAFEYQDDPPSELEFAFENQPPSDPFNPVLPNFEPEELADEFLPEILEKDDGLDPEPDYLADGSESQMSELLDQDSSSILLPDSDEPTTGPEPEYDNIVAFTGTPLLTNDSETASAENTDNFKESIPRDEAINEELGKPDYDSIPGFRPETQAAAEQTADDDHTLNFVATETKQPRSKSSLLWLVGSLLLLPPLAGQLAWQFRDDLIQHEQGRQALNLLCSIAGCEVPARRALDKITIQGRNLSTHPDKPNTLFLQVSIVNTAGFTQPFPRLTLSLYNDKGALIARRTFSAGDYLPPEYAQQAMMPKAQPILVEMELVDPGKEVTGFSFDFH